MKVLLVSIFHPELVRGGAQQICYELFQGLKDVPGIEPVLLASAEPTMPALYKSGARITGFDGRPDEYLFLSHNYDYWWHKLDERLLTESFAEFLELIQPDVVHFHHFLTYGADMLSLTRRVLPNARIVFTFHEFMAICAADGQMVRKTDRSLCESQTSVRCHQCFPDRKPEDFFLRTAWMKRHLSVVDVFTTPTKFMIEPYVKWGLDRDRIVHVTNGQENHAKKPSLAPAPTSRNRFGFFGQFVDNKGLRVVLDAVEILRAEEFEDFIVELNGDNLRYASEANRAAITKFLEDEAELPRSEQRVFLNGPYQVDQLGQRMDRVDWCIVPSVWWEIFGLVISEAWMFGKPVIASNVGGMAERITHDRDGLLFGVGDARALAETMKRAVTEGGLWQKLHSGITPPPSRDAMVGEFLRVYGAPGLPASESATDAINEAST